MQIGSATLRGVTYFTAMQQRCRVNHHAADPHGGVFSICAYGLRAMRVRYTITHSVVTLVILVICHITIPARPHIPMSTRGRCGDI